MNSKGRLHPLSPLKLIAESDTEEMRRLFAEMLAKADRALEVSGRRSIMMPGPFWLLARSDPPFETVDGFWNGTQHLSWPPWLRIHQADLRQDPLYESIQYCLNHAADAGVSSGRDLCRLIAAVAQTVNIGRDDIISNNRALADKSSSGPSPETVPQPESLSPDWEKEREFLEARPDERGEKFSFQNAVLWLGAHVGPAHAFKPENQDAACALTCSEGLFFALADGVSTSLASRNAAALTAYRFCREAARLHGCSSSVREVLLLAVRSAQKSLDRDLETILADWNHPERKALLGTLKVRDETSRALLDNTKSQERDFPPAMSTTLIGGFLSRAMESSEFQCNVIYIGDGVIELISPEGSIDRKFTTDPRITEISEAVGPGPRSKEVLESERVTELSFTVAPGERLLISSDGLARGHSNSVWQELTELVGDPLEKVKTDTGDAGAFKLLSDAAAAADGQQNADSLFADNLSVILVEVV